MKPAVCLEELVQLASVTEVERAARWASAVDAVRHIRPALAHGGGPALDPGDLRLAFEAIDLFVFHARYRAVFENTGDLCWAWCCGSSEAPCDAWYTADDDSEEVCVDGCTMTRESTLVEFNVNADRMLAAFPAVRPQVEVGGPPIVFDDHPVRDIVEAIVGAIGRRMLRYAAVYSTDSPKEADERELLLHRSFGTGPGPLPVGVNDAAPAAGKT